MSQQISLKRESRPEAWVAQPLQHSDTAKSNTLKGLTKGLAPQISIFDANPGVR